MVAQGSVLGRIVGETGRRGVEDEPRTQVSEIRTQGKVMFLFQASGM